MFENKDKKLEVFYDYFHKKGGELKKLDDEKTDRMLMLIF